MGTGKESVRELQALSYENHGKLISFREGCHVILEAYYKSIGGKPVKPTRKRKSQSVASTPVPETKNPRKKAKSEEVPEETKFNPPKNSWENEINSIETIEEAIDSKTGERVRRAYVQWHNGTRSRHPLNVLNKKAPQKVMIPCRLKMKNRPSANIFLDASLLRATSVGFSQLLTIQRARDTNESNRVFRNPGHDVGEAVNGNG